MAETNVDDLFKCLWCGKTFRSRALQSIMDLMLSGSNVTAVRGSISCPACGHFMTPSDVGDAHSRALADISEDYRKAKIAGDAARHAAEAKRAKPGLVRLFLGTFFVWITVLLLSFGASDDFGFALFFGIVGALLIWSGAHKRVRWQRPLGIIWILFAAVILTRAMADPGRVFEDGAALWAGPVIMLIVGLALLIRKKQEPENPA